jgi:3-oxoacyl-[acyl-carrier protein] reductase
MQIRFNGKIVAVTGAGSGFGRAISKTFAGLGARVFGCDISAELLAGTEAVTPITTRVFDLADRAAAADWVGSVERQAGQAIDVLVNNAGGTLALPFRPLDEVPDVEWDRIYNANINGTFAISRAAVAAMKRAGRGRIINISSGAGFKPSLTGIQAYSSTKHAVIGLTKQLALELGPYGITVNSVAPGLVMTSDAQRRRFDAYGEARKKSIVESIALRRLGTEQDIANGVLFFASDLASFVSGQVLYVSGGAL